MAKGQQGVNSITVWMIVFVALWLTATVFLVILYTGRDELRNQNEQLTNRNRQLISESESSALQLAQDAKPEGPTVVGLLESARKQTAELAGGIGADDVNTVRTKRDQLFATMAGDGLVPKAGDFADLSLLEGLTRLYEGYKSESGLRKTAEKRVAELEGEVAQLVKLNADQKNDFDERAAKLGAQLAEAETAHAQYRGERDAAVTKLEGDFAGRLEENTAALRQERQRLSALERDKNELQKRFAAQQAVLGEAVVGPEELATARKPDGRILTAVPGDEVAYIDLGSEDHVLPGLRFSVYSAATGIPVDGRSKAQIEVVSIARSSAECKIVRVAPNEVILESDWIANPVYDPTRSLTFMVLGEFDLDHDGEPDPHGVATIEAMITAWGGHLTRDLTAMTDFLVVGRPPRRPRPAGEVAGEQAERQKTIQAAWDQFQDALTSAKNLSVPMMNQDVFLNFLGDKETLARR